MASKMNPMDQQAWIDGTLIGAVMGYIAGIFFSRTSKKRAIEGIFPSPMHQNNPMQMRAFLALFALLACGCSVPSDLGRRFTVLAYDICVVDVPIFNLTSSYGDDSATGSISYIAGDSSETVEFYIGNFPDLSRLVEEEVLSFGNPDVSSAMKQRHSDGYYIVAVEIRGDQSARRKALFRSTDDLTRSSAFMSVVKNLKRCQIY